MIFNINQDEEAAISVLMDILPRMTGENEHNAVCFAIECLRQNSNLDAEKIKCQKCGNSYHPKAIANDGTGICVNCMISNIANR